MRRKITYSTSIAAMLLLSSVVTAQPLPPELPYGSPVPVGNLIGLLPLAMLAFSIYLLRRKKRET
jgi:LPXTG-motif cell wall-anchored protein